MKATVANMRKAQDAGVSVVAFSSFTGEQYSATPGDYFYLHDNDCLTDNLGYALELVVRRTEHVSVDEILGAES